MTNPEFLDPANYKTGKTGPQFWWLDQRLALHGYPPAFYDDSFKRRVQNFQWDKGWTGSGADGYVGPKTLQLLNADPIHPPDPIDLSLWKLTLPVGNPGHPTEIYPISDTYTRSPWFVRNPDNSLRFRANCGGVTTSGSKYPRCELREMTKTGGKAGWSSTSGEHVMQIQQAITHRPVAKPHVVAGQVHDAVDDVLMIRLENKRLFVESDGSEVGLLDDNYQLGDEFDIEIHAAVGLFKVSYNRGFSEVKLPKRSTGCYFKAGVYTQSNTNTGDAASAYGEVVIADLQISHG